MALYRTQGIVIGRRALGESDRLVDFYTRDHGRLRGVAKSARRTRSRFGSALELFTLGELVFFDTGRSELVRIDHFDIVHPFVRVREHLERLGQGAWVVECLTRLTPDRDSQPALFGLTLRSLRALDAGARPQRVASCFALRAVDLLGHRPRIDRCVECGRAYPFREDALPVAGAAVGLLKRLRAIAWEEGLRLPLAVELDAELAATLEGVMTRLMGHVPHSSRFLAQTRRPLSPLPAPLA
jgi:DNA repair protein RecO (recombination protein O)